MDWRLPGKVVLSRNGYRKHRMHIFLRGFQHVALLGVLVAFYFIVAEGPETTMGRVWWLMACGLVLIWQPLVSAERRLSVLQAVFVFSLVAGLVVWLDWKWLAISVVFLAALVSGKVIVAKDRRLAWFYLMSFGFLSILLFAWISLRLYGSSAEISANAWVRWMTLGALISAGFLMPWRRIEEDARVFDFLISLLVLLMLSLVLMAGGILVAFERMSPHEALVTALVGLGGAILLLNWVWNPRLGFGGFSSLISTYLFRVGFPFDIWLQKVSAHFDKEDDPDVFFERAMESFSELPWVLGGRVETERGVVKAKFGAHAKHQVTLLHREFRVVFFSDSLWSASLIWQANLLFKLVAEFYRARQREHLLRQMQYVQAVYETGSRVTHDVKNLLQSLEGLCFALDEAKTEDSKDSEAVFALMQRQLPTISQRLRATLEKLASPAIERPELGVLSHWWGAVQARYSAQGIAFASSIADSNCRVPTVLFDNVLDNLISNALQKRLQSTRLRIAVTLEGGNGMVSLSVGDEGGAVPLSVAKSLFEMPVQSSSGLGVGLYHAATLANQQGYELCLTKNRPGEVLFVLAGPCQSNGANLPDKG